MSRRSIPLIVVGLVFAGVFIVTQLYAPFNVHDTPVPSIEEEQPITVGVICPDEENMASYRFISTLAEADVNEYMEETDGSYRFEFQLVSADGRSQNACDHFMAFYDSGVQLIVGLSWSSQLDTVFSFAQDRGILVITPYGGQPWPWRLAPTTYRLYPADDLFMVPIAAAIESLGAADVVVLRWSTKWANALFGTFSESYSGEIHVVELPNPDENDLIGQSVEEFLGVVHELNSSSTVVLYLGCFYDLQPLLTEAFQYPELMNLTWFTSEWYDWNGDYGYIEGVESHAAKVKFIGAYPVQSASPRFNRVNELYKAEVGLPLSLHHANLYDALWLTALSVCEADSVDGDDVGSTIPEVTKTYNGVSGNCSFNDYGDRYGVDWTLWGYAADGNHTVRYSYGEYNFHNESVVWFQPPV